MRTRATLVVRLVTCVTRVTRVDIPKTLSDFGIDFSYFQFTYNGIYNHGLAIYLSVI